MSKLPPPEFFEAGPPTSTHAAVMGRYSLDYIDAFQTRLDRIKAKMAKNTTEGLDEVLKYLVAGRGLDAVNRMLHGSTKQKPEVAKRANAAVAKLDEVFKSAHIRAPARQLVYRTLTAELAKDVEAMLKDGGTLNFHDVGYAVVAAQKREEPRVMRIEMPAGTPIISLNKYATGEILLNRGTTLKLFGISDDMFSARI